MVCACYQDMLRADGYRVKKMLWYIYFDADGRSLGVVSVEKSSGWYISCILQMGNFLWIAV